MTTSTSPFAAFSAVVRERHAVKHYDSTAKMSHEEIEELLELAIQTPSSWNLQHWKFLVIEEQQAKEKLLPIANQQKQVVEASVTVAVLGDLQADQNAEAVYQEAADRGELPQQIKDALLDQIYRLYETNPQAARDEAIKNAAFAAMTLMLAAKAKGYDSCPMGGFDAGKLKEVFGIPDRYLPILLISIGKAAKPARPSSRFAVEQVTRWNQFS
ncbi:nitroreductase family protein [Brevibacillus fulvus]|uniref:Nitroreductase n=1 Tax=Brevibacillus fulvus TaxID=1125967 RepID=A0A938XZM5_9BACL|nr:nitroreductase family protein [Brevibacillus fulvus]MBM7588430.1 nitroreductase [Brevibacillus fulvus]